MESSEKQRRYREKKLRIEASRLKLIDSLSKDKEDLMHQLRVTECNNRALIILVERICGKDIFKEVF